MDVARVGRVPNLPWVSVSLLAGVLGVQWLPALPLGDHRFLWPAALALGGCLALRFLRWLPPAFLLFGAAWAALHGARAMRDRLPRALEGQDLEAIGHVVDLPDAGVDAVRFRFVLAGATWHGKPAPLHGEVRLAWYDETPVLHPCEIWHLRLRLKRPRGMINPGGADSERTALERDVVARGYVRKDPGNRRIRGAGACVDGLRARLAAAIDAQVSVPHDAALLRALALGDTRGLGPRDWQVARANGVSHLLAISGFHIGVAAAFGVWACWALYGLWPSLALRWPRWQAQALAALAAALFYGALAGMGLPTVRTLLMIAVVVLARCQRRASRGIHGLALALLAMLLVDPLAVLSAGFWLSFVGVAFLTLCMGAGGRGVRGFLRELAAAQLIMTLALLPLTLWFFGQVSLIGAVSNLLAVPLVSLLVVPLALLGVAALLSGMPAAAPLWLAARVVHLQWWLLEQSAGWPGAQWFLPPPHLTALSLGMLGALWLLAPRGTPMRWLGLLLFLPLVVPVRPRLPVGAFEVWMFDVGQGLSMAVRTRHHVLVYDAGARYPSGFDVGAAAVVPSLRALGVHQLDALVISHADNDHAGGAAAVLAAFPARWRLAGEPAGMRMPMDACLAGQVWTWDRVTFRVLSPHPGPGEGNDRSCVILVDGGGDRMLLTGDITRRIEPAVARAVPSGRPVVLAVPHHGSKTSSSEVFLRMLHPSLALVSAGWRNRFGHPYPAVVRRYRQAGVRMLNTATSGAVELRFLPGKSAFLQTEERLRQRRYWREK